MNVDDYIKYFLDEEGFAPAIDSRPVDNAVIEKYRGILPDRLLGYWHEYGFSGYAEGLFWTVNPADYDALLKSWLENTPLWGKENYYVIARTAFGKLFAWGSTSHNSTILEPHYNTILPVDVPDQALTYEQKEHYLGIFFDGKSRQSVDFLDTEERPLFKPALKKLGTLEFDEMYSFSPALALGGSATVNSLKKVKLLEQLSLLIELDSPQILKTLGHLFEETNN